jgi:hypothetical protein
VGLSFLVFLGRGGVSSSRFSTSSRFLSLWLSFIMRKYDIPILPIWEFPDPEKPAVAEVYNGLLSLSSYVSRASAALDLYDASEANVSRGKLDIRLACKWQMMAGRDLIMSIYHFTLVFEGVRDQKIRAAPSLDARMDRSALKEAGKLLTKNFPKPHATRHAVAHEAEFSISGHPPPSNLKHDEPMGIWTDSLIGRTYITQSIDKKGIGHRLTCDISPQTLEQLETIMFKFVSAFPQAPFPFQK